MFLPYVVLVLTSCTLFDPHTTHCLHAYYGVFSRSWYHEIKETFSAIRDDSVITQLDLDSRLACFPVFVSDLFWVFSNGLDWIGLD